MSSSHAQQAAATLNMLRKPVQAATSTSLRGETVRLHLPSSPEPYVNASGAADFLGIHPKTLMRFARAGVVPAYSFTDGTRHHWRFLKSELDIWMQSRVNSTCLPLEYAHQSNFVEPKDQPFGVNNQALFHHLFLYH